MAIAGKKAPQLRGFFISISQLEHKTGTLRCSSSTAQESDTQS
jgi:hypothetical protein